MFSFKEFNFLGLFKMAAFAAKLSSTKTSSVVGETVLIRIAADRKRGDGMVGGRSSKSRTQRRVQPRQLIRNPNNVKSLFMSLSLSLSRSPTLPLPQAAERNHAPRDRVIPTLQDTTGSGSHTQLCSKSGGIRMKFARVNFPAAISPHLRRRCYFRDTPSEVFIRRNAFTLAGPVKLPWF